MTFYICLTRYLPALSLHVFVCTPTCLWKEDFMKSVISDCFLLNHRAEKLVSLLRCVFSSMVFTAFTYCKSAKGCHSGRTHTVRVCIKYRVCRSVPKCYELPTLTALQGNTGPLNLNAKLVINNTCIRLSHSTLWSFCLTWYNVFYPNQYAKGFLSLNKPHTILFYEGTVILATC